MQNSGVEEMRHMIDWCGVMADELRGRIRVIGPC